MIHRRRFSRAFRSAFFTTLLLSVSSIHAYAAAPEIVSTQLPALLESDRLYYDEPAQTTIAKGNVRIVQGNRVLMADQVIYHLATNQVEARGKVSLLEPDGNVFFAEEAQLRDDLKEGVIHQFRARLADNTLIAADEGIRVDEKTTVLKNATYSPCPLCKEDPTKAPLWQIKSKQATIDENDQQMRYKHMFFEGFGVPMFYLPRFSHATPGADNKSGFLMPTYRRSSSLGNTVSVPYYYTIAPNLDATFTPIFSDKVATVYQGEFRHLIDEGQYQAKASITDPYKVDSQNHRTGPSFWRGHIDATGRFDLENDWFAGFDTKRSSDDSYLRKYRYGGEDSLTTHAFAETKTDSNYAVVRGLSFQGLRATDKASTTPLILPQADMHMESEKSPTGQYWALTQNLTSLTRTEGADSQRISSTAEWIQPYIHPSGQVFELRSSLRGDAYHVSDVPVNLLDPKSRTVEGPAGRVVPQAELEWRLPLVREKSDFLPRIFLEPVWDLIMSPYGGNPNKIPNEDSRSVEFSDDNLFNANHFTGLDRVESGPRTNYGLRGAVHTDTIGKFNFLVGQTRRLKEDLNFPNQSGLREKESDYVAHVGYRTDDKFDFSYRTRIDKDTAQPHRHDVNGTLNVEPLSVGLNYLYLDQEFAEAVNQTAKREQVSLNTSLLLTEEWHLNNSVQRDLEAGKFVGASYGLAYQNQCLLATLVWNRDFTRTKDVSPVTNLILQISFKSINWNANAAPPDPLQQLGPNGFGSFGNNSRCTNGYCY